MVMFVQMTPFFLPKSVVSLPEAWHVCSSTHSLQVCAKSQTTSKMLCVVSTSAKYPLKGQSYEEKPLVGPRTTF